MGSRSIKADYLAMKFNRHWVKYLSLHLLTSGNVAVENARDDDSSDELPLGPIAEPMYYEGDRQLPVYKWGITKGISTDEAVKLLLQQCTDRSYIATHIPTNISKNTVFVVDTSKLLDVEDVKCDDLGTWQFTGSPKFYYSTDQDGNWHKHEDPEDCPADQVLYVIQRQYFTTSTMPQALIIVLYIFGEGEQVVKVKSHGNSKGVGSRSFKRTMKSTRILWKINYKDYLRGKLFMPLWTRKAESWRLNQRAIFRETGLRCIT